MTKHKISKEEIAEFRDKMRAKMKAQGIPRSLFEEVLIKALIRSAHDHLEPGENGDEEGTWHMILLRGLEKCFRCDSQSPVCLYITREQHQAVCSECLTDDERESYHELVERVSEWEHRTGRSKEPKQS